MTMKRRTKAAIAVAAVLVSGLGSSGIAYAAGANGTTVTLTPVPGAKVDLTKVEPGLAVPIGAVPGALSGGKTTAGSGGVSGQAPAVAVAVPGAKPDLAKVVPGVAVPVGPVTVPGAGSGVTTAER